MSNTNIYFINKNYFCDLSQNKPTLYCAISSLINWRHTPLRRVEERLASPERKKSPCSGIIIERRERIVQGVGEREQKRDLGGVRELR